MNKLTKKVVALFLVCCLTLTGFVTPAYSAPQDAFVDALAQEAGHATGSVLVAGGICLATGIFAPEFAPVACARSAATVLGWFGIRRFVAAK